MNHAAKRTKLNVSAVKMEKYDRRLLIERTMNRSMRMLARLISIGCSDREIYMMIEDDFAMLIAIARLLHGDEKPLEKRIRELCRAWDRAEYSQGELNYYLEPEEDDKEYQSIEKQVDEMVS